MMSSDSHTEAVMKGIVHGACDYLIKPVRIEELRNIWQHVVRKLAFANTKVGQLEQSYVDRASLGTTHSFLLSSQQVLRTLVGGH